MPRITHGRGGETDAAGRIRINDDSIVSQVVRNGSGRFDEGATRKYGRSKRGRTAGYGGASSAQVTLGSALPFAGRGTSAAVIRLGDPVEEVAHDIGGRHSVSDGRVVRDDPMPQDGHCHLADVGS